MNRFFAVILATLITSSAYADSLGSAAGGTAANQSSMAGGLCQSSPSALTNGQQAGLLIDCTTHALITSGGGGGGGGTVTPTNSAGAYSAVTVGTSASTAITAAACKVFCEIVNDSPSATICVNVGASATITGTTCAAGEITLPPLWHRSWEGFYVPSDAVSVIASAASTPAAAGAK